MPRLKSHSVKLMAHQLRVLAVLLGKGARAPRYTRATLEEKAGFSEGSGTLNLALNGRKSGNIQKGLLELGLVQKIMVTDDGWEGVAYEITEAGRAIIKSHQEPIPAPRDREQSTNTKYKARRRGNVPIGKAISF